MGLRTGWWLPLLRVAAGGLITSEGARWCAFGGRWVVVALRVAVLNGVVLHRGCAAVRPGWWLPLLRTAAGGLIESEGVLRCALDCGWAALGNCRRGNLRRGCTLVRPGQWLLPPEVSWLGGIGAEGALCCSLGGGWAALGNCRRGKRMPSTRMQAFRQRAISMKHHLGPHHFNKAQPRHAPLGPHHLNKAQPRPAPLGLALPQFPMSRICS